MKQYLIDRAKNVILSKKHNAEHDFDDKMKFLYQDKNYQILNKKLNKKIIDNARLASLGEKTDTCTEKKLSLEMQKLKKKYGVENLSPDYSCRLCNDNGFVEGQMCQCLKKEISKILTKESGFENLENFDTATKTCGESLLPIYKKMKEWCQSDFKKNLVYLAGPTGVGKTHLAKCMANELIERGKIVKIVTAFAMNRDFKEFNHSQEDELLDKYISTEVLFVDDLGTEPKYKNVTIEYLYLVINERKMRKLPTVITSNLMISDLREIYDERIYSRIVDRQTSITILINGDDKRIKK